MSTLNAELIELIHRARDGNLDGKGSTRLEQLVADDADAMQTLVEYRLLEACLDLELAEAFEPHALASGPSSGFVSRSASIAPAQPRRNPRLTPSAQERRRSVVAVLATACAIVAVVTAVMWRWSTATDQPSVVQIEGEVRLIGDSAATQSLQVGEFIAGGQTIHTGEEDSSVVLAFTDGTTLQMNSNSVARIDPPDSGRKRVFLSSGVIVADVAPQPKELPLVITTPHASMRVLGTRFISTASATETRLELEEGEVAFTRKADGQSVRVRQGSYVEASATIEQLESRPLPLVRTEPMLSISVGVTSLDYLSTSNEIVAADRHEISFVAPSDGQVRKTVENPHDHLREVRVSRDGRLVALASHNDHALVINCESGEVERKLPSDEVGVRTIAISPNEKFVAYVDMDVRRDETVVWLHDAHSGKRLRTLTAASKEVVTLDFSPDGTLLAGGTLNGKVIVWDVGTYKHDAQASESEQAGDSETHLLAPRARTSPTAAHREEGKIIWPGDKRIRVVRFSPDGQMLASCDHRGTARVWEVPSWNERLILRELDRDLSAVAFSPNGHLIAIGTEDGRVRLWDTASGDEKMILRVHDRRRVRHVCFVNNGEALAAACAGTNPLTIWDVGGIEQ